MTSDLRNRLLMLLVLPLMALATVGVWLDYRSADEAAGRHDLRLLRLLPLTVLALVISASYLIARGTFEHAPVPYAELLNALIMFCSPAIVNRIGAKNALPTAGYNNAA